MTAWHRYNLICFGGTLFSFFLFLIIAQIGNMTVGLIVGGCGVVLCIILLLDMVCPKCETPLNASTSMFSKHYTGKIIIPEKCVKCGYNLNEEKYIRQREQDPEYIKIKEGQEQEHLERIIALEDESSAFVQECARFGYNIKTAGSLVSLKNINPELIPVMIKYLNESGYSDAFRESVAFSLDVPESVPYFKDILDLFSREKDKESSACWAIACALAGAAKKQEDVDTIEQMIYDKNLGAVRSAFLHIVKKQMKGEQQERVLSFAKEDAELKNNLSRITLR